MLKLSVMLTSETEWRSRISTSLAKSAKDRRQPVDLVADDRVDPAGLDVAEQPLQGRTIEAAAGESAIIEPVVKAIQPSRRWLST